MFVASLWMTYIKYILTRPFRTLMLLHFCDTALFNFCEIPHYFILWTSETQPCGLLLENLDSFFHTHYVCTFGSLVFNFRVILNTGPIEFPGLSALIKRPMMKEGLPLLGFGPSTISTLFVALSLLTSVYFISVLQVTPMKCT